MSIREKLIQLCEQLGMQEEDIDKLRDAPEVKIINQILYFSLEDEALFSGDVTYEEIETILNEQYTESTLDEHYCFMFYESTIGGVHTYTDISEMKERFLEAYNWVNGYEKY